MAKFIFGNGKTAISECAFLYPSFQKGKYVGFTDMAKVLVACPGLFSLQMAKKWHCMTDHARQEVVVKKYDRVYPFQNGTPYISILDYSDDTLDLSDVPLAFFPDRKRP